MNREPVPCVSEDDSVVAPIKNEPSDGSTEIKMELPFVDSGKELPLLVVLKEEPVYDLSPGSPTINREPSDISSEDKVGNEEIMKNDDELEEPHFVNIKEESHFESISDEGENFETCKSTDEYFGEPTKPLSHEVGHSVATYNSKVSNGELDKGVLPNDEQIKYDKNVIHKPHSEIRNQPYALSRSIIKQKSDTCNKSMYQEREEVITIKIQVESDKKKEVKSDGHKVEKQGQKSSLSQGTSVTVKLFNCETCSKSFKCVKDLQHHNELHSGEKAFECRLCGKRMSGRSSLYYHLRKTPNQKPHKCTHCYQAFSTCSDLVVHKRLHMEGKPFKCNLCKKVYKLPDGLASHMRIHLGAEPFKCSYCDKGFMFPGPFRRHMRNCAKYNNPILRAK